LSSAVRVALDATPLLGVPTGVGTFVRGAGAALAARADLSVVGYTLTVRRRPADFLPPGLSAGRTYPASLALSCWRRGLRWPTAEWLGRAVDVVHGTNFVVPPSRHAARVVTVHDLTAVRFPDLCEPASRRYPELVRRAAAEGAWVHTPSNFVATEVIDLLGVPADRVRAVAHGVDRVTAVGGDAGPAGAGRYVLALGTIEPRKDLPLLVRAFDRVANRRSDVRLVIAGADGWGAGVLTEALAAATYGDRVARVGYVDAARRAELLAGAAVFAFPSRYEGFGLPPLEAMAAGVPVVATAAGAVPEVVGDAAQLVPVGDESALAAALAAVLDDSAWASLLVSKGRARVAGLTWDACAAGLASLYTDAIACA
jgi:glycosyltransferase involved in cell wall biosynthesis